MKKMSGKVDRCRVCHREMTDAAHIAAGIGPICAAKAARRGVRSVETPVARYPRERYERITRNLNKLIAMLDTTRYQWSDDDRSNILHWCERYRKMQWRAYRLMTYGRA